MKKMPTNIIIDVDGVMTSSQFLYSKKGKEYKIFGAHDSDGLNLLKKYFKIEFITADKRGFSITKKRIVNDLKLKLRIIGEHERYTFCKKIGFNKGHIWEQFDLPLYLFNNNSPLLISFTNTAPVCY